MGLPAMEQLYVKILLRIFTYAASTVEEEEKKKFHKPRSLQRMGSFSVKSEDDQANNNLIERDIILNENGMYLNPKLINRDNSTLLVLPSYFVKSGVEAIIEDEVTQRFSAEELKAWNLLSRTHSYEHINMKLTILWVMGVFIRYAILLPVRLCIFGLALIILAVMCVSISMLPDSKLKKCLYGFTCIFCFRMFIRAFSGVLTFYNPENRPKSDGICVANHTTPVDVIILGCDNVYALVGQRQGGFLGFMERVLSSCESHVWFERGETRDRQLVTRRMREHVEDPNKLPILVFPEGTCINNTSVMMFKKGSFEVGGTIYPVAIKYDSRFADCFWNSSKYGMVRYLLMMMTSWAIKADVWYLPPEYQRENEDAIQFANRVKQKIAHQGGLVDLSWDGGLKRGRPKETMKHTQQENFVKLMQPTERS
jgi:glycerol-3-phosphate O-acyltransferase 3/4